MKTLYFTFVFLSLLLYEAFCVYSEPRGVPTIPQISLTQDLLEQLKSAEGDIKLIANMLVRFPNNVRQTINQSYYEKYHTLIENTFTEEGEKYFIQAVLSDFGKVLLHIILNLPDKTDDVRFSLDMLVQLKYQWLKPCKSIQTLQDFRKVIGQKFNDITDKELKSALQYYLSDQTQLDDTEFIKILKKRKWEENEKNIIFNNFIKRLPEQVKSVVDQFDKKQLIEKVSQTTSGYFQYLLKTIIKFCDNRRSQTAAWINKFITKIKKNERKANPNILRLGLLLLAHSEDDLQTVAEVYKKIYDIELEEELKNHVPDVTVDGFLGIMGKPGTRK